MLTITNEDNMALMARYPDKYFDLAIVDPPYGIDGNSHRKNHSRTKAAKAKKYHSALWDQPIPDESYFKELFRVSKHQIIWGCNYYAKYIPSVGRIVWDKVNGNSTFSDAEIASCSLHDSVRLFSFMWNGMMQGKDFKGGMQGNKSLNEKRIHPSQKPVAIYKWLLDKYSKPGYKILDTHLGSGSIAIACHDLGRDLIASELEEIYFNDAIQRINNHTNQQKLQL